MKTFNPQKILLLTDFSERSQAGVPYAAAIAQAAGAEVVLLHIVDAARDHAGPGTDDPHLGPARVSAAFELQRGIILEEGHRLLATWPFPEVPGIPVRREVRESSNVAAAVADFAGKESVDLIVISSHGRGLLGQLFVGSVARDLIARSPCAVLCVKRGEHGLVDPALQRLHLQEVAAILDDSKASFGALEAAADLVRLTKARLHVLYAMPREMSAAVFAPDGEPIIPFDESLHRLVAERRAHLQDKVEKLNAAFKTQLTSGAEESEIAEYADQKQIDVVVMSREGFADSLSLFGGAPARLLHEIHCPLLLV